MPIDFVVITLQISLTLKLFNDTVLTLGIVMIRRPTISEQLECRLVKNLEGGDRSLPQDTAVGIWLEM